MNNNNNNKRTFKGLASAWTTGLNGSFQSSYDLLALRNFIKIQEDLPETHYFPPYIW
jgi:hypothetical protein